MNLEALKSELAADAYAEHVKLGSDSGVADALNAKAFDGTRPVPIADLQALMLQQQAWGKIRLAAELAETPNDLRGACLVAVDLMLHFKGQNVHTDLDAFQAVVQGFIGAKLMTQEEADAIASLATAKISRAEQLFGVGVVITDKDVALALRGNP